MEKHRCKLCFKTFANGRALGGHMRSHVMNLYSPPKSEQLQEQKQEPNFDHQFGVEFDSASSPSSSSSSEGEENEEERDLLAYGLRENPKKSVKLVNPEFSFAGSVVVIQDRESETESSKNPTRRRSKRIRKLGNSDHQHHQCHGEKATKKPKSGKSGPWAPEPEPMSSISDTSPEEDVAYCLMMLSRDNWMREKIEEERDLQEEEEEEEEEEDDQSDAYEFFKPNSSSKKQRGKGKYKCETCFKLFKSYQALGGHRASHKKARGGNVINNFSSTHEEFSEVELVRNEEKIHECPVCFRVFASGQALGGHKRSHVIGSQSTTSKTTANLAKPPLKFGESFIDLNLPAPIDDDDDDGEVSQIELSAVSDPEFVKTH